MRPPQSPSPSQSPSEPEEAPHKPSFAARTAGKAGWLIALAVVAMFVLAIALRLILMVSGWLPLVAIVVIVVVLIKRRGTGGVVDQARGAKDEGVQYFTRKRQP